MTRVKVLKNRLTMTFLELETFYEIKTLLSTNTRFWKRPTGLSTFQNYQNSENNTLQNSKLPT